MNKDLENTLSEMGPEYRQLVRGLRAPFEPPCREERHWAAYLVAASAVIALGFSLVFTAARQPEERVYTAQVMVGPNNIYNLAHVASDAAVNEIIRTQHADGGWGNDFLTRQNLALLKDRTDPASRIAYKRALRNLRLRGAL